MNRRETVLEQAGIGYTGRNYKFHKSLMDAFEDSVDKNADQPALIYCGNTLTYREFNEKVNQYAGYLKDLGVTKETPVGICMHRSFEMMIGIYAVLKAGGAYVPLDPDYPEERLNYIIEDLQLKLILKGDNPISNNLSRNCRIVDLITISEQVLKYTKENIVMDNMSYNMAYIIYTSGSTGNPKGVVVEHHAVLNRLYWMQEYFNLKLSDKVLHKTPISFDVSVWELFWPLMYGGILVIAEKDGHKNIPYLISLIKQENISTIHFVPSMLDGFLQNKKTFECKSLSRVICSGEELKKYHVSKFFHIFNQCELFNLYGPTEATVDVTYYKCTPNEKEVPIGKAITNCKLYILDDNLQEVQPGEEGELYIGGICLAREYINRPELTAERFVKNPFSEKEEFIYKTGDLVKLRDDGEILYIGRSDFQVKLRGLRIELGEIENCIRKNKEIKDVVVTVYEDEIHDDKRLVAYLVRNEEYSNDEDRVESWKTIFDETYKEGAKNNIQIDENFSGWRSSYTGHNIPKEDMVEWVDTTVERIKNLQAESILELGCGTGLLLYRIAPDVKRYVGIDLSDVAVQHLKDDIQEKGEKWNHIDVYQGGADCTDMICNEKFDCIIINSVIQLFPSIEYLYRVIENAEKHLKENGKIFIGDVRDLKFLTTFHSSVQNYKMKNKIDENELNKKIKMAVENDKELLVDQQFFCKLTTKINSLQYVEIMSKNMKVINELSKFRYDVILYKQSQKKSNNNNIITFDFSHTEFSLCKIQEILELHTDKIVKFIGINNYILKEEIDQSGKDINIENGCYPAHFYELGKNLSRKCIVNMISLYSLEVIYCVDLKTCISNVSGEGILDIDNLTRYSNSDLQNSAKERILIQTKNDIIKYLPEYMMPRDFIFLDKLSYLPNGKLNRKDLPKPDIYDINISTDYVPPKTEIQKELQEIWSMFFNNQRIGIEDSFLELGGHSLMAVKLMNIVESKYNKNISLTNFFMNPTIKGLSQLISNDSEYSGLIIEPQQVEKDREKMYSLFPLTDMQMAYFIGRTDSIDFGNISTHVYTEFEFESIDIHRFEKSVQYLIERHGMLRCVIDEMGQQKILEKVPEYKINYTKIPDSSNEQEYIDIIRDEMFYHWYDISKFPLFEVRVTELNTGKVRVHVCYENIIIDGASQGIIIDDMIKIYKDGIGALKPLDFTFRDYVLHSENLKDQKAYKKGLEYWQKRCNEIPDYPNIPTKTINFKSISKKVKRKEAVIDKTKWAKLKRFASRYNLTNNSLLISAYIQVLGYWSNQEKLTINIPTFKRYTFHEDIKDMIGEFGSMLLLDAKIDSSKTFIENSINIQETFLRNMEHGMVSGVTVLRELSKYKQNTIMPIVFTSLLDQEKNRSFLNEDVPNVYWRSQSSQVWLDAVASELDGALYIDWDYQEDIFEENQIKEMFESYISLLKHLAEDEINWDTNKFDFIPVYLKKKVEEYNNTLLDYSDKFLHELFYESYCKNPNAIVCISDGQSFTYKEMYMMACGIKNKLLLEGVKPKDFVAVRLPKGWKQVAAVLGVLFAGAGYIPIDILWPQERVDKIYSDAGIKVAIDLDFDFDFERKECKFEIYQEIDDIAYVLYTSGSTGLPKGVAISHRAACNTILDINKKFEIGNKDCVFAISELHFDLSVYDIFGMFSAGGTICIPVDSDKELINTWSDLCIKNGVTVWNSVPALLELFLDENGGAESVIKELKTVMLSGDWIPLTLPKRLKSYNDKLKIYSLGGSTEASIWSIYYPIEEIDENWTSVPYGKPLGNQTFYVLDNELRICPEMITGELYIGGKGLAKGYLNDIKKTNEKFIIHPKTGERLYATGDLGKFRKDKLIEFQGRKDYQVKLNGYRIELGEIENSLNEIEYLKNVVVMLHDSEQGRKNLVAYYVSNSEYTKEYFYNYLEKKLPKYMIPSVYIKIESIPLSNNGKVDRKAISKFFHTEEQEKIIAQDEIEENVLKICRELLQNDEIELNDDFFSYGGNSSSVIRFIARICEEYKITVKIKDLFKCSGLKEWADIIKHALSNKETKKDAFIDNYYPETNYKNSYLSMSQLGVWINEKIQSAGSDIMSAAFVIRGRLNINYLDKAINCVLRKHAIFHIDIDEEENFNLVQKINIRSENKLKIVNVPIYKESEFIEKYKIDEMRTPFSDNLYRFTLLVCEDERSVLIMSFHHIISDEDTFGIIEEEIATKYNELLKGFITDTKMEYRYFDYVKWESEYMKSENYKKSLVYWTEKLKNLNYLEIEKNNNEANSIEKYDSIEISQESMKSFVNLCIENKVSEFCGYMSMYCCFLHKITGQRNLFIGLPISSRSKFARNDVCGMFLNMQVLALHIDEGDTFINVLEKVSKELFQIMEYGNIPFEVLIRELKINRKYINIPFHVNINYLANKRKTYCANDGVIFEPYEIVKFKVIHNMGMLIERENTENINCYFSYQTKYISIQKGEECRAIFKELFNNVLNDSHTAISFQVEEKDFKGGNNERNRNSSNWDEWNFS